MIRITTLLLVNLLALSPALATEITTHASPQRWVAQPDKSSLSFTATQEGAEFSGQFHRFSVSLELQAAGHAIAFKTLTAVIQLASVDTQYQERDDYLAEEDWFYTLLWPEARFQSKRIRQIDAEHYIAEGTLELRGMIHNVTVNLELTIEDNGERGQLKGSTAIKRLDFGVGQGDWDNTEWVGDLVSVEFNLQILRAFEH